MADIYTSRDPVYEGIVQKYVDSGDSFARVVEVSATTTADLGDQTTFKYSVYEGIVQKYIDRGTHYERVVVFA